MFWKRERDILNEELKKRNLIRRSAFIVEPAKKGQRISDCKIDFRRPGTGIRPDQFELIQDSVLLKDLDKDQMLSFSDISWKK